MEISKENGEIINIHAEDEKHLKKVADLIILK